MEHQFPEEQVAELITKFPAKYQYLLKNIFFTQGLEVPFELTFTDYKNLNEFLLLFNRQDFSDQDFPEEFSVGICATCPKCGQLDMSGAMGFDLIEVNAQKIREMKDKNGEIINVCLLCKIDMLGVDGIRSFWQETTQQVKTVRSLHEKKTD